MDMHFPTDLMVYVGRSEDYYLNKNTICDWCSFPVVAAMSITDPTYKWTLTAV
jgi:predicted nucleic acid-binding Zn finger protein